MDVANEIMLKKEEKLFRETVYSVLSNNKKLSEKLRFWGTSVVESVFYPTFYICAERVFFEAQAEQIFPGLALSSGPSFSLGISKIDA